MGVDNLRAYSLEMQASLRALLREAGILTFEPPQPERFGAFSLVPAEDPAAATKQLAEAGVTVDARGKFLRLSPDLLNSTEALVSAVVAFRGAPLGSVCG